MVSIGDPGHPLRVDLYNCKLCVSGAHSSTRSLPDPPSITKLLFPTYSECQWLLRRANWSHKPFQDVIGNYSSHGYSCIHLPFVLQRALFIVAAVCILSIEWKRKTIKCFMFRVGTICGYSAIFKKREDGTLRKECKLNTQGYMKDIASSFLHWRHVEGLSQCLGRTANVAASACVGRTVLRN